MSRTAKLAIILIAFSICGAGGFIASTVRGKSEPQKANAMPVKNREMPQRIWLRI